MTQGGDYFMLGDKSSGEKKTEASLTTLMACLAWQVAMGADEAHAPQPIDRFKEKDAQNLASLAPSQTIASRAQEDRFDAGQQDAMTLGALGKKPLGSFDAIGQATNLASQCKTLDEIVAVLQQYEGCALKGLARNMVFGEGRGDEPALMVIGDAPDEAEDKEGRPFVGQPGQLIKKALAAAGFDGDNTYFTNSIYWKRPGSRAANSGEQKSCLPFLLKQIEIINPAQIWLLGIGGALSFFDSTIAKCHAQKNLQLTIGARVIRVVVSHAPDYYWQRPLEKKWLWQDILSIKTSQAA